MGQKAITIYTPSGTTPHIFAEDDAQVHRALIGESGITLADNKLQCLKINDNTVRLSSGIYSIQGYLLAVQGGTTADLTVESGSAGAFRKDLVVAEFNRGGGVTPDSLEFRVIKGTNATSAASAEDPALVQDDLRSGGSRRQEAVFRITLSGTSITSVERVAYYIGNVYQ